MIQSSMVSRNASIFALLFFVASGWFLLRTHGMYSSYVAIYAAFFLALSGFLFRDASRNFLFSPPNSMRQSIMATGLVLFIYLNAIYPGYIYPQSGRWLTISRALGSVALLTALGVFVSRLKSEGKIFWFFTGLCAFCLVVNQFLMVLVSPKPFIDVWVNNTNAVDFFLARVNPYQQNYPDIYAGLRAYNYGYKAGFLYFPGTLLILTPFRWLAGDIRYASVVANLATAYGWYALGDERTSRGNRILPALLWLAFPVANFVTEQAWTDPLLVACAVLGARQLFRRRWLSAGVILGLAFAIKQYGFLIPFFGIIWAWHAERWAGAWRVFAAGALTFLAILVPFAVWDWPSFYFSTIQNQVSPEIRRDALTFTAYVINSLSWRFPKIATAYISAAGILAATLFAFSRAGKKPKSFWAALFFGYGMAFVFGKWAFCNYYYLLLCFPLGFLITDFQTPAEPMGYLKA